MPRTPVQALGFLLGFWLALWLSPFGARADGDPELARIEAELHRAVLAVRARHHLIPLQRHAALDAVARAHGLDMVRRGYLAHDTPEGLNPLQRLQAAGLEGFRLAAENLGRSDAAEPVRAVVEGWLASPLHRRNLLAPAMNATGLAAVRAPDGALVVTQLYLSYPREARRR